jgi:adenylate cyclase class 2
VIEIEVKARLIDVAATESRLVSFALFEREFEKTDAYYVTPGYDPLQGKGFRFRLRSDGGRHFVSYKTKSLHSGVEVNEEREFSIEDPEGFLHLAKNLGAVPDLSKRKTGRSYLWEGLTLELCRVDLLGDFIEIEALLDDGREAEIEGARGKVLGALSKAGVDISLIEPRSWAELLKGLDNPLSPKSQGASA